MKQVLTAVFGLLITVSLALTANAAGTEPEPAPKKKCAKGKVWSASKGKCLKKTSSLEDDAKFNEAVRLAYSGKYQTALSLLKSMKNQDQAKVLNYIGFTTRKLGRVDEGLGYYQKALIADPDYVLAREYMGEGYLQKGDLASAEGQLHEIGQRCGKTCSEYQKLARAIMQYRATGSYSAKHTY